MDWFENTTEHSALSVNKGIAQPLVTNEEAIRKFRRNKRKNYSVSEFVEGILAGDVTILSQAITLIESSLFEHKQIAQEIIEKCLPFSGKSVRIGITGVPGVGKSTFIESLGLYLIDNKQKLAVLAIDPSSERSSGSILGDKTRMELLSANPHAYIRPTPSSGSLGGVARKTRETIILCEAAGYQSIFVETVGVGQSETTVYSMVDFFLLLMLAGAGDELQGIKRGIMEMADALVITKADGSNIDKARIAKAQYTSALHLFPPTESGWIPQVLTSSSRENKGIEEVWKMIESYLELVKNNEYFVSKRREQAKHWMFETINETLKSNFYNDIDRKLQIRKFENQVMTGQMSSFIAAKILLDDYFKPEFH